MGFIFWTSVDMFFHAICMLCKDFGFLPWTVSSNTLPLYVHLGVLFVCKKNVPQGWFLDECAWCAGAYLGAYQWAAPLLAVGEKRWRWQGGRTKYVKSAYNKAESSYLWGVCWFQQVNRSHVCCPYTGVFHCFPATSYNKGMMIATGCLIKA